MSDSRVGVIVPCYSHPNYLAETLDSLADQTRPPDRVVVIDDYSSRGEKINEICDALEVEYHRHDRNRGLSGARNTGYELLDDCNIVMSLDDDDLLAPGYIDLGLEAIERSPDIWCAYGDTQLFGFETRVWNQPRYNPELLKRVNYIVCASLWRREAWLAVRAMNGSGYDAEVNRLGGWEDYLFNLEALIGCRKGDQIAATHMGQFKYWFLYRRHKTGSMADKAWANRYWIRNYIEEKMHRVYGVTLPADWERYYA